MGYTKQTLNKLETIGTGFSRFTEGFRGWGSCKRYNDLLGPLIHSEISYPYI
jgi:hypothetical protein